jgi:hypothetical protein
MDQSRQWKRLIWPDGKLSLSDEDFICSAVEANKEILPGLTEGRAWAEVDDGFLEAATGLEGRAAGKFRAEVLFYFLAQIGRRRPGLFPVPDITLAAFNILAGRHNLWGDRVVCLDLALLPVAMLAAGWGAQVVPPSSPESWPEALFSTALSDDKTLEGALVLGGDPLKLAEARPDLLNGLSRTQGGIIFCNWDFLGVNLYGFHRMIWLEQGIIRSIVQLPHPRRQSARYYPALVEIRPGRPYPGTAQTLVRLADVREKSSILGHLSQSEIMEAVFEPSEEGKSLDIAPARLANDESGDFTPRRFLTGRQGLGEVALGGCARLLRCHLSRARHDPKKKKEEEEEKGVVCREISLSHLDGLTGFTIPGTGQFVRVNGLDPRGHEGKFLLRRNDILMCYRGTEATIGRVGLVAFDFEEPSICGQSICVVRAKGCDPVWLYYHLRSGQVRRRILGRCSGRSMLTVNIGDLRELPVGRPRPDQSVKVSERHERLLATVSEVRQSLDKARGEMEALDLLFLDQGGEGESNGYFQQKTEFDLFDPGIDPSDDD